MFAEVIFNGAPGGGNGVLEFYGPVERRVDVDLCGGGGH